MRCLLLTLVIGACAEFAQAQAPRAAAGRIQQLRHTDGSYPATYDAPELVGKYGDDFGQCRLELFANGTGTFTFKEGYTQHVRWGVRLDSPHDVTARFYRYDDDGLLVYEVLFDHLGGDKRFEYEQAEYMPSFKGRGDKLYLVVQRGNGKLWALHKED